MTKKTPLTHEWAHRQCMSSTIVADTHTAFLIGAFPTGCYVTHYRLLVDSVDPCESEVWTLEVVTHDPDDDPEFESGMQVHLHNVEHYELFRDFVVNTHRPDYVTKPESIIRDLVEFDRKYPKGRIYSASEMAPEKALDAIVDRAKAALNV